MKILGMFFIGLGVVDFLASLIGIDFYAYFGINLTGYAYEYSPYAAGILGFVIYSLDKNKDIQHEIETSIGKNEKVVLTKFVNVRKGGFFSGVESGTFFVTNQRIGYLGNYSQKGEDLDNDDVGELNFSCNLSSISSVEGSLFSIQIGYDGKTFKFLPGMTQVKKIVAEIEQLRQ